MTNLTLYIRQLTGCQTIAWNVQLLLYKYYEYRRSFLQEFLDVKLTHNSLLVNIETY